PPRLHAGRHRRRAGAVDGVLPRQPRQRHPQRDGHAVPARRDRPRDAVPVPAAAGGHPRPARPRADAGRRRTRQAGVTGAQAAAGFGLRAGGGISTYRTRSTSSDITSELTTPPMTTVASGRCTSAPTPVLKAIGTNPRLATSAVISTGRS